MLLPQDFLLMGRIMFMTTTHTNGDQYYAKNEKGYANLIKLCSAAWCKGRYMKPRINWELIEEYHEGLICLSACLSVCSVIILFYCFILPIEKRGSI